MQDLQTLFRKDRIQPIPDYPYPSQIDLRYLHRSQCTQTRALNILEFNSLPDQLEEPDPKTQDPVIHRKVDRHAETLDRINKGIEVLSVPLLAKAIQTESRSWHYNY